MLSILINALKIIFLLGFLVFIHEGGHFCIAKLCKVRVNEFAIGFGPTLFSKIKGDTKYALHLIPFGGFVSLEGEEEHSDIDGSFSNVSIPKKIAIVLAGGTVNIVFGLMVYFILLTSSGNFSTNIVDYAIDGYSAKTAGIISGDKIVEINNKKVRNNTDINKYLNNYSPETELTLKVKRNNEIIETNVKPVNIVSKDIGIYFTNTKDLLPKIAVIENNSPAQIAGIKENDIIISVNNNSVENDLYKAINLIQNSTTETINLSIERNGEILEFNVVPKMINNYYLGVVFQTSGNNLFSNLYYAMLDTEDFITSIFSNLKELFTGKVNANQMVGIVGISDIVVNTSGIYEYIYIIALISLSLGITNLLPFPPLDGGKVVIYLIEAIRKKPMKENFEIQLQMIGFAFLIILSIYVTYNDILRII